LKTNRKHYSAEQINKKLALIQVFCEEEQRGEIISGILDQDFNFVGTLRDFRKELKKHIKGGDI